jgi:hypothetical protein
VTAPPSARQEGGEGPGGEEGAEEARALTGAEGLQRCGDRAAELAANCGCNC